MGRDVGADGSRGAMDLFTQVVEPMALRWWSRWLLGCDGPLHSGGGADGSWGVMDLFTQVMEPMALGV